jgi:hypothetical protein
MWQKRIEKKIGQILLDADIVTKNQLNTALKRQTKNGQYLGKNLIELGYIDENRITRHLAEQYRVPYVSLSRYKINNDFTNIIPLEISKTYGVIPLDLIGDILAIGIVDAPDEATIKRMEELTGFKIRVLLITSSDFSRYIEKVYDLSIIDYSAEFPKSGIVGFIKTLSYKGKERRRFPRFKKRIKFIYESKDEYNIKPSINVSQGGALVKSKSPVPVGSHLIVRMELPNLHEDIIVISRIVRVERISDKDIYLVALSFTIMDAADSRRLAGFIKLIKK